MYIKYNRSIYCNKFITWIKTTNDKFNENLYMPRNGDAVIFTGAYFVLFIMFVIILTLLTMGFLLGVALTIDYTPIGSIHNHSLYNDAFINPNTFWSIKSETPLERVMLLGISLGFVSTIMVVLVIIFLFLKRCFKN